MLQNKLALFDLHPKKNIGFTSKLSYTGNIRVYCRIRPFLPGQKEKRTSVEHIGDNGELVVADRSKPGKDGHRLFKFNKVFGSDANQGSLLNTYVILCLQLLDRYCLIDYSP